MRRRTAATPACGRRTPAALPRPALWPAPPPGQPARAFDGLAEERARAVTRDRWRSSWLAVGLMLVGAVLVGLALALQVLLVGVAGVLVGGSGVALAWKVRLMEDVSVEDSPTGSG